MRICQHSTQGVNPIKFQIFDLDDFVGPGAMQRIVSAIQRIRYTQGRTNTHDALRFMREDIFNRVCNEKKCISSGVCHKMQIKSLH